MRATLWIRTKARHAALAATVAALAVFGGCGGDDSNPVTPPLEHDVIFTFAGTGVAALGVDGLAADKTALYLPVDIAFDPAGNSYIVDWNNHRIRKVEGNVTRTICGTGIIGDAPAGVATEIDVNHPTGVTFDPNGNMILSAWHNSKVMRLDFATGLIAPICGSGARSFSGDGGPATAAVLDLPVNAVFDAAGRLFIADQANNRVRMIDGSGMITTVAGSGPPHVGDFSGDGGPATAARLNEPWGQQGTPAGRIAIDAAGNLYICDTLNHRIRKVDTSGVITTIAGNGTKGFSGDGGPATSAMLNEPTDVEVDAVGNVYIADTQNNCIRKVDTAGIITTFAGIGGPQGGYGGDGGSPREARLYQPFGIALDAAGNLYIADTLNNRIRVVLK